MGREKPVRENGGGKKRARTMTRSELIAHLAERKPHLCQRDIRRGVATMFKEIGAALARGDRVELRGFGAFSVKQRDARMRRNPRTGQHCHVSAKAVLCFKIGKRLRERINSSLTD